MDFFPRPVHISAESKIPDENLDLPIDFKNLDGLFSNLNNKKNPRFWERNP
jgi:hypothetical protein